MRPEQRLAQQLARPPEQQEFPAGQEPLRAPQAFQELRQAVRQAVQPVPQASPV